MPVQCVQPTPFRRVYRVFDHHDISIEIRVRSEGRYGIWSGIINRAIASSDNRHPTTVQEINAVMNRRGAVARPTIGKAVLWHSHILIRNWTSENVMRRVSRRISPADRWESQHHHQQCNQLKYPTKHVDPPG